MSQPEAQLSTCLVTVKDEDVDGITEIGDVQASRKSIKVTWGNFGNFVF